MNIEGKSGDSMDPLTTREPIVIAEAATGIWQQRIHDAIQLRLQLFQHPDAMAHYQPGDQHAIHLCAQEQWAVQSQEESTQVQQEECEMRAKLPEEEFYRWVEERNAKQWEALEKHWADVQKNPDSYPDPILFTVDGKHSLKILKAHQEYEPDLEDFEKLVQAGHGDDLVVISGYTDNGDQEEMVMTVQKFIEACKEWFWNFKSNEILVFSKPMPQTAEEAKALFKAIMRHGRGKFPVIFHEVLAPIPATNFSASAYSEKMSLEPEQVTDILFEGKNITISNDAVTVEERAFKIVDGMVLHYERLSNYETHFALKVYENIDACVAAKEVEIAELENVLLMSSEQLAKCWAEQWFQSALANSGGRYGFETISEKEQRELEEERKRQSGQVITDDVFKLHHFNTMTRLRVLQSDVEDLQRAKSEIATD